MSPRLPTESLRRLLRPASIAVIGGREAEEVVRQCDGLGYTGAIWPVSRSRDSIGSRDCFRRLEDLPGPPDAAFIAIPAEPTIEAVAVLAGMGAGGAVCYASGFREVAADGIARQDRLAAAAGGMAILGPNCYGFLNYLDGAALWPDLHGGERIARGVAIVTQSGNMGLNFTMQQRSLPLAHLITLGNQAVIGMPECIAALAEDQRVTAIGLHIEGLADLAAFEWAVGQARGRGLPLVALKTGGSVTGAEIALSHTASLAGPDGLYDAFFERLGIARVHSVPEFIETLKLLAVIGPLAGSRICSMSCSGGEASLIADMAEGRNVGFPRMADVHRAAVAATLDPRVSVSNPLDYHTYIWGDEDRQIQAFTAMLAGNYDLSLLILDFPRPGRGRPDDWWKTANALVAAARRTGAKAAIVASLPECLPEDVRAFLIEQGIAPMQGMAEALAAVEAAARIGRTLTMGAPPALLRPGPVPHNGDRVCDEWESKRLLAAHGLAIPEGALVASPAEAVAAAAAFGYPVVVKAVSPDFVHKTEQGAVALNLADADAVQEAAERMAALSPRILVERMVTDGIAELIIGIDRDPQFGPYLVVGFGGILVELVSDSHTLLLPAGREQIVAALGSLKTAAMLDGYRGVPLADKAAAIDAVMAVVDFAAAHADTILELDVNPLIVRPEGLGAVAADALVRLVEPQ